MDKLADKVLDCLWVPLKDCIFSEVNFIISWEDNLNALGKEMSELNAIRNDLDAKVKAAGRRGIDAKSVPEERLARAKTYDDEATNMDKKRKTVTKCLCGLPLNILVASEISKKAVKMRLDVEELTSQCNESIGHDVTRAESAPVQSVEMLVGSTTGVEWVVEQLERHIQDVNVPVIGVYGMPGVGKTDIMRQVNNKLREMKQQKRHDYIIFVDMRQDSSINEVQQVIGKQLAVLAGDDQSQKALPVGGLTGLIAKQLKKSRFVLILDGVHKHLDLKEVGIPPPRRPAKSKIIVVSQSRQICSQMDADKKVHVKCMEENVAWNLFESKADKEVVMSDEDIRTHAKNLVAKCGGLPPALIKLGQAMESETTVRGWERAVSTMDIAPWDLVGMEIFSEHLRVSYDNLADDQLRICLLYCSLYREGCSIHEEWIIDYCIGEGVIDGINMEEIYSKGYEMLGELKAAHLLEAGEDGNHVKMHPMVRGLALWIACDQGKKASNWLVRPNAGLPVVPPVAKWRDAERISLMENDISEISEIPDCPSLKTLLMQRNGRLEKICDGFFNFMPQLRVLDLSHNKLKQLPAGIQMIKELRYLDLCVTNIESLPPELKELKKLRFLLLAYSRCLKTIPDGVISSLKELQVLYMHVSYGDWKVGSVGSGVDFNELNALEQLTALGITIQTVYALQKLVQSRRLANSMRFLNIKGCRGLPTINLPSPLFGSDMTKLELILLSDSSELEEVVIGGETNEANARSYLPKLEVLVLSGLAKAKMVYHGGCLSHLRQLYLWRCQATEHLLQFNEVKREEEDDAAQGPVAVIDAFPNLRKIEFVDLPAFKSLSRGMTTLAFPVRNYGGIDWTGGMIAR